MSPVTRLDEYIIRKIADPLAGWLEVRFNRNNYWFATWCLGVGALAVVLHAFLWLTTNALGYGAASLLIVAFMLPSYIRGMSIAARMMKKGPGALDPIVLLYRIHPLVRFVRILMLLIAVTFAILTVLGVLSEQVDLLSLRVLMGVTLQLATLLYVSGCYFIVCTPKRPREKKVETLEPATAS